MVLAFFVTLFGCSESDKKHVQSASFALSNSRSSKNDKTLQSVKSIISTEFENGDRDAAIKLVRNMEALRKTCTTNEEKAIFEKNTKVWYSSINKFILTETKIELITESAKVEEAIKIVSDIKPTYKATSYSSTKGIISIENEWIINKQSFTLNLTEEESSSNQTVTVNFINSCKIFDSPLSVKKQYTIDQYLPISPKKHSWR